MTMWLKTSALLGGVALTVGLFAGELPQTPSPEGARVYLISPEDGAVTSSPLVVRFGLEGMGVAPAGVQIPETGHHHLLVDKDVDDLDLNKPLGDEAIHFGLGQTETTLELEPGKYTLQLVLGDYLHIPHTPAVISEKVVVTIE